MEQLSKIELDVFEDRDKKTQKRLVISQPSSCTLDELLNNARRLGINHQKLDRQVRLPPALETPSLRLSSEIKPHRLTLKEYDQKFGAFLRERELGGEKQSLLGVIRKYFS